MVEPPVPVEEAPPLKRGLSYEVHIAVRPDEVQTLDVGAPPAPPPTGHDGRRRRRRRSRSPDSSPRSSADGSPARGAALRSLEHVGPMDGGYGTGAQETIAGESGLGSEEAVAAVVPSPGAPPVSATPIDDMAARVIHPLSGDGARSRGVRRMSFPPSLIVRCSCSRRDGPLISLGRPMVC